MRRSSLPHLQPAGADLGINCAPPPFFPVLVPHQPDRASNAELLTFCSEACTRDHCHACPVSLEIQRRETKYSAGGREYSAMIEPETAEAHMLFYRRPLPEVQ